MITLVQKQHQGKRVKIVLPAPSVSPIHLCPICQGKREKQGKEEAPLAPVGYVCIQELRVPVPPEYEQYSQEHMLLLVQQEQIRFLQTMLDYDRVVDWARTTKVNIVGLGQRQDNHPLQRYLHEIYKLRKGLSASWQVYPSACEAFKGMSHVSHTRHQPLCTNAHLLPSGEVSLTLYCPLPSWTRAFMDSMRAIPNGCKITREMLCTLLRTRR
jgi:hypothetical protein